MFKKLSKTANPKVCFCCRVMTSSKWQNPNIQLVCAESAVKFNIWDVVNQSIKQSIFRVAYVTNSYHKDHARKKVNLEDKARIGEWKKMQF